MVGSREQCEICRNPLLKCDFIKHHRNHIKNRNFPCKFCSSKFTTVSELNDHFKWHHKVTCKFSCSLCQNKSNDISAFFTHLEFNHENDQTPKSSGTRKRTKNSKSQTPPSDLNFEFGTSITSRQSLQVAATPSKISDSTTNNCKKLDVCENFSLNTECGILSDLCSNSQMSINSCIGPVFQGKVYSNTIDSNFIPENCNNSRISETPSGTMTREINSWPELSVCENVAAVVQDDLRPNSRMSVTSVPVINVEDMRNGKEIIIPGNVPSVVVNLFVGNNSRSSTPVFSINERKIDPCDGSKTLQKTSNKINLDCDTLLSENSRPNSRLSLTLAPNTNKEGDWKKLKTSDNVLPNINRNFETFHPCSSLSITPVSSVSKDDNTLTMKPEVSSSISLKSENKAYNSSLSNSRVTITPILPNKETVNLIKESKILENVNLNCKTVASNNSRPNSRMSVTMVEMLNKPKNVYSNSASLHFAAGVTHSNMTSNPIVTKKDINVKYNKNSVIPENLLLGVKDLNFVSSVSNTEHSRTNTTPTFAINEECVGNWEKSKTCDNNSVIDDIRTKIPLGLQVIPVSKERLTIPQSSKSPTSISVVKSKSSFEVSDLSEKSIAECKIKAKTNLNKCLVHITPHKMSTEVKSTSKPDDKKLSIKKKGKLISHNHKLETNSSMVKKLEVSCPITLTSSTAECNEKISSQFPILPASLLVKHNDELSISCQKNTSKDENLLPKNKQNISPIFERAQLNLKKTKLLNDILKDFQESSEKEYKIVSKMNVSTSVKSKQANETLLSVNEIGNLSQNTLMNEKSKSPRRNKNFSRNKDKRVIASDSDEILPQSKRKCKNNKSFTNISNDLKNKQILNDDDSKVLTSKSCSPKKLHEKESFNSFKISPLKIKSSYSNQESKNKEAIKQYSCAAMKKSTSEDIELMKKFLQSVSNQIINYDHTFLSNNNVYTSQSSFSKLTCNDFHCFLPQVDLERLPISPEYCANSIRAEDILDETNSEISLGLHVRKFDKGLEVTEEYNSEKSSNSAFVTKITAMSMCNVLQFEMLDAKNQSRESELLNKYLSVSEKSLYLSTVDKSKDSLKQSNLCLKDKKKILEKLLLKVEEKEEKKSKKRMEKLQKSGRKLKVKNVARSSATITSAKFESSRLSVPGKSLISTISITDTERNIKQAPYPGNSSLDSEASQNKTAVLEHDTCENKKLPNVGKRKTNHTKANTEAEYNTINCSLVENSKRKNKRKIVSSKSTKDHTNLLSQNSQSALEYSESSDDEIQIVFVLKPKDAVENTVKVEPDIYNELFMDNNEFSDNASLLNAKLAWDIHEKAEKRKEKSAEYYNESIDLPPPEELNTYTISCPCGGRECNGSNFRKIFDLLPF